MTSRSMMFDAEGISGDFLSSSVLVRGLRNRPVLSGASLLSGLSEVDLTRSVRSLPASRPRRPSGCPSSANAYNQLLRLCHQLKEHLADLLLTCSPSSILIVHREGFLPSRDIKDAFGCALCPMPTDHKIKHGFNIVKPHRHLVRRSYRSCLAYTTLSFYQHDRAT